MSVTILSVLGTEATGISFLLDVTTGLRLDGYTYYLSGLTDGLSRLCFGVGCVIRFWLRVLNGLM